MIATSGMIVRSITLGSCALFFVQVRGSYCEQPCDEKQSFRDFTCARPFPAGAAFVVKPILLGARRQLWHFFLPW